MQPSFKKQEGTALLDKLDAKLNKLSEQYVKTNTFIHTLSRNRRHILTPLLSGITGLASDKTVSQLHSMLQNIDLRSQRNHLRTDAMLMNQQQITKSLNDTMQLVNFMKNSVSSQQKKLELTSSINTLFDRFHNSADELLNHYRDLFELIQNPTLLIQVLPNDDLVNIKKTISNHADITSNLHPLDISLISLLKMAKVELFTDKHEQTFYLMMIIPLFDPIPHKIKNFVDNRLISQSAADSQSFSIIDLWKQHKYTHDHDLLITDRRLIHRRKSDSWEEDLKTAAMSNLIADVIFITRTPQSLTINCGNKSTTYQMSDQPALAIYIPHSCSLSSELLYIPTHNYHASISITQSIHITQIKANMDFSTHPDTHKDLIIANLTDLSLFNDSTLISETCNLDFISWLKITATSISSSFILLIIFLIVLFCKGFTRHRYF